VSFPYGSPAPTDFPRQTQVSGPNPVLTALMGRRRPGPQRLVGSLRFHVGRDSQTRNLIEPAAGEWVGVLLWPVEGSCGMATRPMVGLFFSGSMRAPTAARPRARYPRVYRPTVVEGSTCAYAVNRWSGTPLAASSPQGAAAFGFP